MRKLKTDIWTRLDNSCAERGMLTSNKNKGTVVSNSQAENEENVPPKVLSSLVKC